MPPKHPTDRIALQDILAQVKRLSEKQNSPPHLLILLINISKACQGEPKLLNKRLQKVLSDYWQLTAHDPCAYTCAPDSEASQLGLLVARYLHQQNSHLTVYQYLMPTIKWFYSMAKDRGINLRSADALPLSRLLVSEDLLALMPSNLPAHLHRFKKPFEEVRAVGPQGQVRKARLTVADWTKLRQHNPKNRKFMAFHDKGCDYLGENGDNKVIYLEEGSYYDVFIQCIVVPTLPNFIALARFLNQLPKPKQDSIDEILRKDAPQVYFPLERARSNYANNKVNPSSLPVIEPLLAATQLGYVLSMHPELSINLSRWIRRYHAKRAKLAKSPCDGRDSPLTSLLACRTPDEYWQCLQEAHRLSNPARVNFILRNYIGLIAPAFTVDLVCLLLQSSNDRYLTQRFKEEYLSDEKVIFALSKLDGLKQFDNFSRLVQSNWPNNPNCHTTALIAMMEANKPPSLDLISALCEQQKLYLAHQHNNKTLLRVFIEAKHWEAARLVLSDTNPYIELAQVDLDYLLLQSMKHNQDSVFDALLKFTARATLCDLDYTSAALYAFKHSRLDCFRELIKRKIKPVILLEEWLDKNKMSKGLSQHENWNDFLLVAIRDNDQYLTELFLNLDKVNLLSETEIRAALSMAIAHKRLTFLSRMLSNLFAGRREIDPAVLNQIMIAGLAADHLELVNTVFAYHEFSTLSSFFQGWFEKALTGNIWEFLISLLDKFSSLKHQDSKNLTFADSLTETELQLLIKIMLTAAKANQFNVVLPYMKALKDWLDKHPEPTLEGKTVKDYAFQHKNNTALSDIMKLKLPAGSTDYKAVATPAVIAQAERSSLSSESSSLSSSSQPFFGGKQPAPSKKSPPPNSKSQKYKGEITAVLHCTRNTAPLSD